MDFQKAIPDPVNLDLLQEQVKAVFSDTRWGADGILTVFDVQPEDEASLDAILANHDPTQFTATQRKLLLVQQMAARGSPVAADLSYFKASSDEVWTAIEQGKPDISAQELDDLHTAFSVAIAMNTSWQESHNFMRDLYRIAFDSTHPLYPTHKDKALDVIGWYSFNVIASIVSFLGNIE